MVYEFIAKPFGFAYDGPRHMVALFQGPMHDQITNLECADEQQGFTAKNPSMLK